MEKEGFHWLEGIVNIEENRKRKGFEILIDPKDFDAVVYGDTGNCTERG